MSLSYIIDITVISDFKELRVVLGGLSDFSLFFSVYFFFSRVRTRFLTLEHNIYSNSYLFNHVIKVEFQLVTRYNKITVSPLC